MPPKYIWAMSGSLMIEAASRWVTTRPLSITMPSVAIRIPNRTFCSTTRIVLPLSRSSITESYRVCSALGSSPSDGSSSRSSTGSSMSDRANSTIRR